MRFFPFILLLFNFQISISQITKNFIDQNYIEVQGKAEKEVTPDIVYLSITLDEKDTRDRESLELKENQLINTIINYGIDPKENLRINNLSSEFHWYLFRGTEIVKERNYQLKIDSIEIVGNLIIDLEKQKISNIYIEKAEYSDLDQAIQDLKIEAITNSKLLAENLAQALNQTIGKAIHIMDHFEAPANRYDPYLDEIVVTGYAGRAKQEMENVPLNVRPIKLVALVEVKYELQ